MTALADLDAFGRRGSHRHSDGDSSIDMKCLRTKAILAIIRHPDAHVERLTQGRAPRAGDHED